MVRPYILLALAKHTAQRILISLDSRLTKAGYSLSLMVASGFPFVMREKTPSLRRAMRAAVLSRWPKMWRPLARIVMIVSWPVVSAGMAIEAIKDYLNPAPLLVKVSIFGSAWRAALTDNVPPNEFIAFRQYLSGAAGPNLWIYGLEYIWFIGTITSPETLDLAHDKVRFARFCAANSIPSVDTLAIYGAGGVEWGPSGLPGHSIVVKPRFGSSGEGVELWLWNGLGYICGERSLSPEQAKGELMRRGRAGEAPIVQGLVPTHGTLEAIAGDGTPSLRVISLKWPDGHIEIGPVTIQSAGPGKFASQSGSFRIVDAATGSIRAATPLQKKATQGIFLDNPAFDLVKLPYWAGVVQIVIAAHQAFPAQSPVLGWDVLISPSGPVLCEVNTSLSFYHIQAVAGEPMVPTGVGRVLQAWAEWRV